MTNPLKVFIGWDQRDAQAYEVAAHSIRKHASVPVEIVALKDWELRARGLFWRAYSVDERGQMWDSRDGSPFTTNFSYTRYLVPLIEDFGDEPVVFMDADMLVRADIADLVALLGDGGVACVKHDHRPPEQVKITNNIQRRYARKNWASVMVMRPSACTTLTKFAVNNMSHDWLHQMVWIDDADIVGLPEAWNWLCGWSDPAIDPNIVHYTRGTPDIVGVPGLADYSGEPFADDWRAALAEARKAAAA